MVKHSRRLYLFMVVSVFFPLLAGSCAKLGGTPSPTDINSKVGVHLVFQADLSKKGDSQTNIQVMASIEKTVEQRIGAYNASVPVVQTQDTGRILVVVPAGTNVSEVTKLIGQVAQLDIKVEQLDASGNPVLDANGQPKWVPATAAGLDGTVKPLTGQYLKPNVAVQINSTSGKPEVLFNWNAEGANLFKQITTANINKPLGIFLDNQLISAPTVQAVISGSGVITGLTLADAKNLAIQLNSGSLAVPLTFVDMTQVR